MKKIYFLIVMFIGYITNAQVLFDYYSIISGASISANSRAPQGGATIGKAVYLITASEMATSGFPNGSTINLIGFNYQSAQNISTTSTTFNVYLQNTTDTTNLKSTTWTAAITGMTLVNNGNITIPATTGILDFAFSGGSSFTYTGGAIYVAFDYQNTGTIATTANVAYCNISLTSGLKGAWNSTGTAITTISASNFRPETRFGKSVSCTRPTNLTATQNYTTTSAELSWAVTSGGTVDFEYGPYNYTFGSGTTNTAVTSPFTQIGLTASTPYETYIRKNCGAGNYSDWFGPIPFHTTFLPTNSPYNTGFNYEDLPMIGWLNEPTTDGYFSDWYSQYGLTTQVGGYLVQEGAASAYSTIGITTATLNTRMYSRGVNLTAGSSVTVSWYDRNYQRSLSTNNASYNVTVGSAQTSVAQTTNIASITGVTSPASTVNPWTLRSYNYITPSTGVYYFSFQNVSPANTVGLHGLAIDNFTVTQVLSTESFLNNKFSISPNPTSGLINVNNNEGINVNEITITDLNGRVVKTNKFDNLAHIQVNISDLSAGIYMMNIKSDAGAATKKVIKE